MKHYGEFEKLFDIMSNRRFLDMEGLGNEVPFFIHAYDIRRQSHIYREVEQLKKRLYVDRGIETALIGLYDMVIDSFTENDELEDVFAYERENTKEELIEEFTSMINPEDVILPYFRKKREECDCRIMMVYQVGEVYPYLRTHDILNQLQSAITDIPLVVFFPGEYVMSREDGFNLNLFGKFPGPYYRAFKLDDYVIRGKIDG